MGVLHDAGIVGKFLNGSYGFAGSFHCMQLCFYQGCFLHYSCLYPCQMSLVSSTCLSRAWKDIDISAIMVETCMGPGSLICGDAQGN